MIFSTAHTGATISRLRKAKNMTQMELADLMGISFQAVSNWERGNSMPDISKLPELAQALDTTIDTLLGSHQPLVEKAAENKLEEYVQTTPVTAQEVVEAAPLLKPAHVDELMEKIDLRTAGVNPQQLLPFVSESCADTLLRASQGEQEAAQCAPFASQGAVDELAEVFAGQGKDMLGLAPFMSDQALQKVAQLWTKQGKSIAGLAPFLSTEEVDAQALALAGQGKDMLGLAPFMSDQALQKVAQLWTKQGRSVAGLLPFLPTEYVDQQALALAKRGNEMVRIAPMMSGNGVQEEGAEPTLPTNQDDMDALFFQRVEAEEDWEELLPHVSHAAICKTAKELALSAEAYDDLLPYMSQDEVDALLRDLAAQDGDMEDAATFASQAVVDELLRELTSRNADVEALLPRASTQAIAEVTIQMARRGEDIEDLLPYLPQDQADACFLALDAVEDAADLAEYVSKAAISRAALERIRQHRDFSDFMPLLPRDFFDRLLENPQLPGGNSSHAE